MGQIFYSCAYDTETRSCCVYDADKFHANCFSFSGSVFSIHYLLRQKTYRVMWGGHYVIDPEELSEFSKEEDLLGLSTFLSFDESDLTDPKYTKCLDKVKFIYDNSKSWKRLDVWDDAKKHFNMDKTHCVKYENFLVNHTQKLAIDLADYFNQSVSMTHNGIKFAIDPIPVLTETGGGTEMLFLNGITEETTEQLTGQWRGDLLQIVDTLPEGYAPINCCFAEAHGKQRYCYYAFGKNKDGYLLKDTKGNLCKALRVNFLGERGPVSWFKVKETENSVIFSPSP